MWSVFNTCVVYSLPSFQFCQCLTGLLNLSFSSSGFLKWTSNFNRSWCNAGGNSISNKSSRLDLYRYICQHSKPVCFSNEDASNLMSLLEKSSFFVVVHFPRTLRGFVHFCKSPSDDVISASDETLLRVCLLLDEQFCVLQMSGPSSVTSLTSRLLDAGKRFVARGLIDRTQHEARLWLALSVGSRTGIYIAAGLRGDYAAEKRHLNAAIPYFFCNIALLYK